MYIVIGVYLQKGKDQCGIMITNQEEVVEVKVGLPEIEPEEATLVELLSMTVGIEIIHSTGLVNIPIEAINDNTKTVITINTEPDFKECVEDHCWFKTKLQE